MLRALHTDGFATALKTYGIKEAGVADTLTRWGGETVRTLVGQPWKLGPRAFQPGGMLHWKNVFWPTVPGRPVATWLNRGLGTILPAYDVYKTMQGEAGDPTKGRLANTLAAAGNALGWAYGMPAVGLLGAPMLGQLGRSLGENIGRLVEGEPRATRNQIEEPSFGGAQFHPSF
jgi:hypothetical protein